VTVRQLVQHLTDTAPGGAEVLVHLPGVGDVPLSSTRVETRPGHIEPVVIVYVKPS
jgi:hypothetical protein